MKKIKTSLVFLTATNFLGVSAEECQPNTSNDKCCVELTEEESLVKSFDADINHNGVTVVRFINLCKDLEQLDLLMDKVKETTEIALNEDTKVPVKYIDVFTEEMPSLAKRYEVEQVPTILFFKNGQLVCKSNKPNEENLVDKIQEIARS